MDQAVQFGDHRGVLAGVQIGVDELDDRREAGSGEAGDLPGDERDVFQPSEGRTPPQR